ncbi:Alkaline phosphatase synthesis sensor protein PhoR [Anaerolineae bacterium]|nr:Alkaline phosphatase synthesis sensor protein PhoR [Anaerolineae bacterium]
MPAFSWLLLPGTIIALTILSWTIWRARFGQRAGLIALVIIAIWWTGVLLLALTYSEAGWILQAIAFVASMFLLIREFSRRANQQAEITRLQRIAESRADRISVLSHEVRTPLAMIKGAAELLLEGKPGPLTQQQNIFLQAISQNCERTINLAEDLLTQARIEAGLFKVNLQATDLKVLTRQVRQNMKPLLEQKNQTINLDYPQVLQHIQADPRLIQQALTNLLNNAMRYTSPGGCIYVSISENDQAVIVAITDDGAGMTAAERQKLFQRFSSGRPLGDGTGLGLVIVKQIVELHGGRILVDTTLGQGTTFLFTLPRLIEKK